MKLIVASFSQFPAVKKPIAQSFFQLWGGRHILTGELFFGSDFHLQTASAPRRFLQEKEAGSVPSANYCDQNDDA